ncbi:hypothetical protein GCM10010507_10300 [Streptomyces cinnamoneus]|uniref:Uncharacterized protein n=1 Tax=Streptomyces cinnamoneus TaxID=53446 RepID=A0A918WCY0_STRCJ|nr:hypothetical protein GCM10010507_10300 [Streptomyces cinnamoneus]
MTSSPNATTVNGTDARWLTDQLLKGGLPVVHRGAFVCRRGSKAVRGRVRPAIGKREAEQPDPVD